MSSNQCILSLDQGTTSTRAIIFDSNANIVTKAQQEFPQIYPNDGWVEHDAEVIWQTAKDVTQTAFNAVQEKGLDVVGIGITNQRETTVVWDRATGKPIYNAIVWQDRRTADVCRELKAINKNQEAQLQEKTGLLLDPYFSATKVAWILDNVEGARARADKGELAFGTIDSFLIWKLTGGKVHATDATNASRTNLYNIHTSNWDESLLSLFNVPASMLPKVMDCSAHFGDTYDGLLNQSVSILGVAGDQQSASIGQCCFEPGSIKSTYGTGCFVLMNTGDKAIISKNRLLTTVAYQLDGKVTYATEGAIFIAGAAVQWLRDGIGIIEDASETEKMAKNASENSSVHVVPAFTGLGAPYWEPDVRGAIFGLTRDTGPNEIVKATLEGVCFLTADLFKSMASDGITPSTLRVDGGMVRNDWMLQFLSDLLNIHVIRPQVMETTALGAAYLAGRKAGIYGDFDEFSATWQRAAEFNPKMETEQRNSLLEDWHDAVDRVISKR